MSTTTGVGAFTECLKNSTKGKKNSAKVWNEYGHCVGHLRPNFSGKGVNNMASNVKLVNIKLSVSSK